MNFEKSEFYEVYIETQFSSAHRLTFYKGKCENFHGHNWKIGVLIKYLDLDKNYMTIDFNKLKKLVNSIIEPLDHKYLNKIKYFSVHQPTAENIAKYVCEKLYFKLKDKRVLSIKIVVWETPQQYASYEKILCSSSFRRT